MRFLQVKIQVVPKIGKNPISPFFTKKCLKMHISFTFPPELWEKILDHLDTNSLLNFQHTCQSWRSTILDYIMRGRLKNRALVRRITLALPSLSPAIIWRKIEWVLPLSKLGEASIEIWRQMSTPQKRHLEQCLYWTKNWSHTNRNWHVHGSFRRTVWRNCHNCVWQKVLLNCQWSK